MAERWPEGIRRRMGAEALRRYAALLAEHERIRRLVEESAADPEAMVAPSGAAWKPLREVAFFQGMEQRAAALRAFCSEFVVPVEPRAGGDTAPEEAGLAAGEEEGEGKRQRAKGKGQKEESRGPEEPPRAVPMRAYREALAAAVDLAGDEIVASGAEVPWGAGQPRAPRSAEAFEAICRRLRDGDTGEHGLPSLGAVLDSVVLPPVSRVERLAARVIYNLAQNVLKVGRTRIFLPEGRERDFLRVLAERRDSDKLTPPVEHGIVWANAVDQLRRRIRRYTGQNLLREVVLPATAPVGAYRLNPKVRVHRV